MKKRVVITGMGVVSPNGVGLSEFEHAIKSGFSGINYYEELKAENKIIDNQKDIEFMKAWKEWSEKNPKESKKKSTEKK